MEMFHKAWEKTFPNVYNEQIFESKMVASAFHGSEEHLASKKLMNIVCNEMFNFREELLKSKARETNKHCTKNEVFH